MVAALGKVANHTLFYPTHPANPQNGPIFRPEQTYSCHILFEKEISAESHFAYQKTPIKPLNQHMLLKLSAFFYLFGQKEWNLHIYDVSDKFPRVIN